MRDLEKYLPISSYNDETIFMYNQADAVMYNEMYGFKKWPSMEFDLVEIKLRTGENFDFRKAFTWMREWKIEYERPQYVFVREGENHYTVYFSIFESIQYFRKFALNEDIYFIGLHYGYYSNYNRNKETRRDADRSDEAEILIHKIMEWCEDSTDGEYDYDKSIWIDSHSQGSMYQSRYAIIFEKMNLENSIILQAFQQQCDDFNVDRNPGYHTYRPFVKITSGTLPEKYIESK